ncbi:MAG: nucleoside deaminase [Bacteroidales bacterium]|nr:nucleoside deaminase [Bacteroidales bacterium]
MGNEDFMREAIAMATTNVANGGGPFGAIVVKNGKVIGRGVNRVTANNDPTAHAEVNAIRDAARNEGAFDLSGAEIYTSCEPCPMCLGAIYWARISKIFYGNTKTDAARINFDDSFIYKQLSLPENERSIPQEQMLPDEAIETFKAWDAKTDKTEY